MRKNLENQIGMKLKSVFLGLESPPLLRATPHPLYFLKDSSHPGSILGPQDVKIVPWKWMGSLSATQ